MGGAEFSDIGKRGRDDKNTALIFGMFDRHALLCHLIWIKSSLEAVWYLNSSVRNDIFVVSNSSNFIRVPEQRHKIMSLLRNSDNEFPVFLQTFRSCGAVFEIPNSFLYFFSHDQTRTDGHHLKMSAIKLCERLKLFKQSSYLCTFFK